MSWQTQPLCKGVLTLAGRTEKTTRIYNIQPVSQPTVDRGQKDKIKIKSFPQSAGPKREPYVLLLC